jgi:hypothetical protein
MLIKTSTEPSIRGSLEINDREKFKERFFSNSTAGF